MLHLCRRRIGNGVAAELPPHHSRCPTVMLRRGGGGWRRWRNSPTNTPDGRWKGLCARAFSRSHHKPLGSEVMKHSLQMARAALAALPRCTATSRQSGEPCKLPGTGAGGKCRFHGGASTGRPPIHGRNTANARLERDWARLLLGAVASYQGGKVKFFKPGRLTVQRVQEVLNAKISK
jgi:hypothetical protein